MALADKVGNWIEQRHNAFALSGPTLGPLGISAITHARLGIGREAPRAQRPRPRGPFIFFITMERQSHSKN
jgi:hypothetical protein